MLQTTEFFREQIRQCRDFAASANNKNDRDFWLKMADRWESLLQTRQSGRTDLKVWKNQRLRLHHRRFANRRRAA
jgi:hypothetical protein